MKKHTSRFITRLALLLTVCMVLGSMALTAAAAEDCAHSFESGKCTVCGITGGYCGAETNEGGEQSVCWTYDEETGAFTVSGSGAMKDYDSFTDRPWNGIRSNVTSLTITEGVTRIGDVAFHTFKQITAVTVPASVDSLGYCAFAGCEKMQTITFAEGSRLTTLDHYVFQNCHALKQITLPAGVTGMGSWVFYDCKALTDIFVAQGNTTYKDMDGVLYSADGTTLVLYPDAREGTEFTTPAGVTTIGEEAFQDNLNLQTVTLSEGVTTIEGYAFLMCRELENLNLPDSLTTLGNSMIGGCMKLTSIELPETLTKIDDNAFCTSCLTEITIPAGVKTIGDGAFSECDSLTTVTIPQGVTSIGRMAFWWCENLTTVTIPASVTEIGEKAFYDCDNLTTVNVPCNWDTENPLYTFESTVTVTVTHSYTNGFCDTCGAFQSAELVNGVYEIGNAGQLYWFAQQVNSGNIAIDGVLVADIVVNQDVLKDDGSLNGDGSNFRVWTPIGYVVATDEDYENVAYIGDFDGAGHSISGLYYNDKTAIYVGFIGYTNEGFSVKDLTVTDSYIRGAAYVGGIVGCTWASESVTGCTNAATVEGVEEIGGIVGGNYGTDISGCVNTGLVIGVFGINTFGDEGSPYWIGGIAGTNHNHAEITRCVNRGKVRTADGCYVGGIVGENDAVVSNCCNVAAVSGKENVGGVVGSNSRNISDCFNVAAVSGNREVGGVVGRQETFDWSHDPVNCYYLADSETDTNDGTTAKTAEAFASGEVAYLLQGEQTEAVWGQTIGTDAVPVLGGAKVYYGYTSCADDAQPYSNSSNVSETKPQHNYVSGICTVCGAFHPDTVASVSVNGTVIGAYTTIDEAVAAAIAEENSTVLILKDCTVNLDWDNRVCTNIESGTFTVDLGGCTVNSTSNYCFRVFGGNVTFTDSVGGGKVTEMIGIDDYGTVTIEGGDYRELACYEYGTLNISGGTFECVYTNFDTTTVNISGGSFAELCYYGNHSFDEFLAEGFRYYDAEGNEVDTSSVQPDRGWYYLYDVTVEPMKNPFTDVPEGSFYYDPVMWALDKNITTGTTPTTFSPLNICNRGQVVTFLWRAAGSPEPTTTVNPFVDVPEGAFYYKAVLWAVENDITTGVDATHFAPNANCNRGQVVTFLWRAAGRPAPASDENPFVDVPEDAFYYEAVLWAVENNITNGVDATHFAPVTECNRAQVVTFLYRTFAK